MADTLKASIAKLTGKRAGDLKPEKGPNLFRSWSGCLADLGYTVKTHGPDDRVADKHIIIYAAPDGTMRSVVSDDEAASQVAPLARWSVTKAPKTAGEPKGA